MLVTRIIIIWLICISVKLTFYIYIDMNLKDLPASLLQASQKIVETQDVLESCPSCGCVFGSCFHTEGQDYYSEDNLVAEDAVTAQAVKDEDEPEEQLSGEKEEVEINPEYKTFTSRRP